MKEIDTEIPEDEDEKTSRLAIASLILGLSGMVPFTWFLLGIPSLFAILTGILALIDIKEKKELTGEGTAILGIILGVLFSITIFVFHYVLQLWII